MNRITQAELREIGRVSLNLAPEPRETLAQSLAASAYRLSYLFTLCAAVAIAYLLARMLPG